MFSVAITTYNRYEFVCEAIAEVLEDNRVVEIVISDDASTDDSFERLSERYKNEAKVRLFRNEHNLDCYRNKAAALTRVTGDWAVLFDSDNILTSAYLDALERCMPWDPCTAYLPVFAEPEFDYTAFEGITIDRRNVARYMRKDMFTCALNTANYFVNCSEYLRAWDGSIDPHTSDSIYQNYRWLSEGNRLYFTPGLKYFHRMHEQSHFLQNYQKTGRLANDIENRLLAMR